MSKFEIGDKVRVTCFDSINESYARANLKIGKIYTVTDYTNTKLLEVDSSLYVVPSQIVRVEDKWNHLTVEELQQVCDTMPGGIEGFCKGWGWLQFAREVEKLCQEKNS